LIANFLNVRQGNRIIHTAMLCEPNRKLGHGSYVFPRTLFPLLYSFRSSNCTEHSINNYSGPGVMRQWFCSV